MSNMPPIAKADLKKTQHGTLAKEEKNSDKVQNVIRFINQPSMKSQLAAALPRHL
ncbi:hypothetical protein GL392_08495 [Salmonella enterica]|nr:hypothetical protein [Salmonella enterica]